MLKVAVVTHYFPTSVNPWAGHSAYQTLRRLTDLCDIHVFWSDVSYPPMLAPKGDNPIDPNWAPPGAVKVTYLPYLALPVVTRPLNGMTIERLLLPHVRAFQPDIVLNYMIYPQGYAAVKIARALGVPSVLTAIGSDLNRISDPLCGMATKWALHNADFVATVSGDLRRTALRLGADPNRSAAILNGCDTTVFYPRDRKQAREELKLGPEDEIVLYVGRLDLRKGLVELVEAISTLRSSHPKLQCYIMGDGADRGAILKAIEKFDIPEAVNLIPSELTDRVAVWMAAADLVTLPSYNEGCPNVVIEALSSGRPVVATHVGGIPELMSPRCGRLVPVRNVHALTGALDEVLSQSWDADEISRTNSRSWEDVAQDLLQLMEEVLAAHKSPTPV
jgi:glycosyltransferase involved in cell wall biosynthesis